MMFFLRFIHAYNYKVKLAKTERYLKNDYEINNNLILDNATKADVYSIFWEEKDAIKKWFLPSDHIGKAIEYDKENNKLQYSDFLENAAQSFEFVPIEFYDRSFWILNNGQCLTWKEDVKKFLLEPCYDDEPNQLFEFVAQGFDYSTLINIDKDLITYNTVEQKEQNEEETQYNYKIKQLESEIESLLKGSYKILYDLNLCFGNSGVCLANSKITSDNFEKSSSSYYSSSSLASS